MAEWFQAGYFSMSLLVKRGCDEGFQPLGEVIKMWGRVPFAPGPSPPPLLVCAPHPLPPWRTVLLSCCPPQSWLHLCAKPAVLFQFLYTINQSLADSVLQPRRLGSPRWVEGCWEPGYLGSPPLWAVSGGCCMLPRSPLPTPRVTWTRSD